MKTEILPIKDRVGYFEQAGDLMRINNNLTGTHVNRLYTVNTKRMEKSIEKLSQGRRITKAVDDASGLSISEKLHSQVRSLRQGMRNAQDGISLVQTVEGALGETQSILHRMRDLAVQSGNDTYQPVDRVEIQNEFEKLASEITRISTQTEFNTKTVLDGSSEVHGLIISLGASGVGVDILTGNMGALALNLQQNAELENGLDAYYKESGFLDIQSAEKASLAIGVVDRAIGKVGQARTNLGSIQNRLESAIANLGATIENVQASESRIRDLDLPNEVMEYTKTQIIGSSVNMLLVHANIDPTSIVPILLGE